VTHLGGGSERRPGPEAERERKSLRAFNRGLYRFLKLAITLLMGLLIVPVSLQIFSRYVGFIPRYIWTEEVARLCLIWIIMLGAIIAVRDGTHFDLDVLPRPKTSRGMAAARLVTHAGIAVVALTFLVFGWRFALFGFDQSSELTGLNMATIHIAWPFAGLAMLLFLAEKAVEDVRLWREGDAAREPAEATR
jgi:TRAP-type C4-dicarboxylate transport system permease small subunit